MARVEDHTHRKTMLFNYHHKTLIANIASGARGRDQQHKVKPVSLTGDV